VSENSVPLNPLDDHHFLYIHGYNWGYILLKKKQTFHGLSWFIHTSWFTNQGFAMLWVFLSYSDKSCSVGWFHPWFSVARQYIPNLIDFEYFIPMNLAQISPVFRLFPSVLTDIPMTLVLDHVWDFQIMSDILFFIPLTQILSFGWSSSPKPKTRPAPRSSAVPPFERLLLDRWPPMAPEMTIFSWWITAWRGFVSVLFGQLGIRTWYRACLLQLQSTVIQNRHKDGAKG
jgi:hypothetical protein